MSEKSLSVDARIAELNARIDVLENALNQALLNVDALAKALMKHGALYPGTYPGTDKTTDGASD